MSAREAALKARIQQLLALDPQKPVVSNATLTVIAREFSAAAAVEDSDVLAERRACLAVMEAHLARLIPLAAAGESPDAAALQIELTRHGLAIDGVRQGLHRDPQQEDRTDGV